MKYLTAYAASAAGFAAAMALHAYAEKDPELRAGKTRAIAAAPLWPVYLVTAAIFIGEADS